jgi:translation elongation factor EF-G
VGIVSEETSAGGNVENRSLHPLGRSFTYHYQQSKSTKGRVHQSMARTHSEGVPEIPKAAKEFVPQRKMVCFMVPVL